MDQPRQVTSLPHLQKPYLCCYQSSGSVFNLPDGAEETFSFHFTMQLPIKCPNKLPQVHILLRILLMSSHFSLFHSSRPACLPPQSVDLCLNASPPLLSHCVHPWLGCAPPAAPLPCTLLDTGTFPLSFGLNKYVLWTPSQNALAQIHAYSQSALLLDTSPEDSRGSARMVAPIYLLRGQDANRSS